MAEEGWVSPQAGPLRSPHKGILLYIQPTAWSSIARELDFAYGKIVLVSLYLSKQTSPAGLLCFGGRGETRTLKPFEQDILSVSCIPFHHSPRVVGRRGLEPPRDCSHYDLNVARLPFRHLPKILMEARRGVEPLCGVLQTPA